MPFSSNYFKKEIKDLINGSDFSTFLDVGAGAGVYGQMIRELKPLAKVDAVEVHQPYVEQFKLNKVYDEVFNVDVSTAEARDVFFDRPYDCVIIGDCIEHLLKSAGVDLLHFWWYRAKRIIVVYPVNSLQYTVAGVKSENHVSVWDRSDFALFDHDYFSEDIMRLVVIRGLLHFRAPAKTG